MTERGLGSGDDTATETPDDPYPARRRFFHVTTMRAIVTVFFSSLTAAGVVLGIFSFIARAELDNRMLSERDWVDVHYVSLGQESERVKSLDVQLQQIRETQIQDAMTLHEIQALLMKRDPR